MIVYNGQSWLLYLKYLVLELGKQTCWGAFGFHFLLCVQFSWNMNQLFFQPISFKLRAICVHVSIGL
jgi:hypothetical protein